MPQIKENSKKIFLGEEKMINIHTDQKESRKKPIVTGFDISLLTSTPKFLIPSFLY